MSAQTAQLPLPDDLIHQGFALQPAGPAHQTFLEQLFIATRSPELQLAGWPRAFIHEFLQGQFKLQASQYAARFPGARQLVVERHGTALGQIHLHVGQEDLRIVDIALLPDWRNGGIGTRLLQAVKTLAARHGLSVSLHVHAHNPAQGLYRRLGFELAEDEGFYRLQRWKPDTAPADIAASAST